LDALRLPGVHGFLNAPGDGFLFSGKRAGDVLRKGKRGHAQQQENPGQAPGKRKKQE